MAKRMKSASRDGASCNMNVTSEAVRRSSNRDAQRGRMTKEPIGDRTSARAFGQERSAFYKIFCLVPARTLIAADEYSCGTQTSADAASCEQRNLRKSSAQSWAARKFRNRL